MSVGVQAGSNKLREEIMSIIQPVRKSHLLFQEHLQELEATIALVGKSATLAMETIGANGACTHKCTSDERDWSLVECEEFQELAARVTYLESLEAHSGPGDAQMKEELQDLRERLERMEPVEAPGGSPGLQYSG